MLSPTPQMTLRQIEEAKHAFTMFDTDHVGFIDGEHLMKALASLGRPMGAEARHATPIACPWLLQSQLVRWWCSGRALKK